LAQDVYPDNENEDDLIVKLTHDADFLAQTKLAEIFASDAENIQIFFTDYFGIKDVYNVPGTSGDENWSLRLPNNYAELQCQNLKNNKALNLPLVLKIAIESRGKKFGDKYKNIIEKLKEYVELF